MKNLRDLLDHQIKDLYSAEKQMLDAFPAFIQAASDDKLVSQFQTHYDQTQDHMKHIQAICDELDVNPGNSKCKAMEGLIAEGEHMCKADAQSDVKDAGLIAACQRIEHYEISGYGTARHYADRLGLNSVSSKLKKILEQEQHADTSLNELAINTINKKAMDK